MSEITPERNDEPKTKEAFVAAYLKLCAEFGMEIGGRIQTEAHGTIVINRVVLEIVVKEKNNGA